MTVGEEEQEAGEGEKGEEGREKREKRIEMEREWSRTVTEGEEEQEAGGERGREAGEEGEGREEEGTKEQCGGQQIEKVTLVKRESRTGYRFFLPESSNSRRNNFKNKYLLQKRRR